MMPVAKGAKSTRIQILIYTVLYLAATAGPVVTGLGGWIYAGDVGLGGALFALLACGFSTPRAGDGNNAEG
jgi:protoheme IX farnesyltransferase